MNSMDKKDIKIKLQEALAVFILLRESKNGKRTGKRKSQLRKVDGKKSPEQKIANFELKNTKKSYADVQRAFKRLGGPSMVDIMKMIGIPDDKTGTNRSLFRKKVLQKKNKDTGSYYQFDDEELDKVRAAIDSQK